MDDKRGGTAFEKSFSSERARRNMPVRFLAVLAVLIIVVFLVIGLAAATGWELYIFRLGGSLGRTRIPGRSAVAPPTPPGVVAIYFTVLLTLSAWSRHYALIAVSLLFGLALASSLIGLVAWSWIPSLAQLLLCAALGGLVFYGWKNHEYLDY